MQTEQQAAATLLNKGIKVRVSAPFLLKVFGRREVSLTITQPKLGSLYRISRIYLQSEMGGEVLANINEANAHDLFTRHGMALAKIAAAAWLNGYWRGKLFNGIVARWLYWHLTPIQLLTLANVLTVLCNTQAFTNTIRLAATMRMTAPNLSQTAQGS